jgi:hypothetical protein
MGSPVLRCHESRETSCNERGQTAQRKMRACNAAIESLRVRLESICADILQNGGNADKLYAARTVAFNLLHKQRMLQLLKN